MGRSAAEFKLFGQNVRDRRILQGLSTLELAHKANISENTLTRVQRGERCSSTTAAKIADALKIADEALWKSKKDPSRRFVHFKPNDNHWNFSYDQDAVNWPLNEAPGKPDPNSIQDATERVRLGRNKISRSFYYRFDYQFSSGFHCNLITENYCRVPFRLASCIHAMFLFCLRGTHRIHINNDVLTLSEGQAIVYDTSVDFEIEPLEAKGYKGPAPLALAIPAYFDPPATSKQRVRKRRPKA